MLFLILLIVLLSDQAWATVRYLDNTLGANCTDGSYSIADRTCGAGGTDGNAYITPAAVISPTVAGDTIYVRSGTITQQFDFMTPDKSGSASGGYITLAGLPGERPTFTGTTGTYGAVRVRGNRGYFIFENFIIDLTVTGDTSTEGWQIREGNHHFILRNLEIVGQRYNGLYLDSVNDIQIINCDIHNARLRPGTSAGYFYGIYAHDGSNLLIEGNRIYDNTGGGVHVYPGPWTNVVIRNNKIYDNTTSTASISGGIHLSVDSSGGNINGTQIYGNEIYGNGVGGIGGGGGAIKIQLSGSPPFTMNNTVVHNNVGYNNQASAGKTAYGIIVGTGITGTNISNNIFLANESGQIEDGGTSTVTATNKTTGVITDCTISTTDFRLKQGVNTCRDAGTAVSTRPAPVGTTDIGAYEQGIVASAAVASGFIEVTMNVMTPGVLPTSGITGFTIANGTSTGTPVVSAASIKAGSDNIILLTTSGFTGTGTCTISLGSTNLTDSLYIGGSTNGTAQGVNSASSTSVSGTCDNSAGGTPPGTNLHIHYKLNEGAGTTAADEVAANDGTLSGSPTWTTPVVEGAGLTFAAGQDQRVSIPYGNAVDPRATSFTFCLWVKPVANTVSKIVMGPPNGTNQRMYFGINASGFWGLGVGSSTFDSGNTEFASSATLTRVCLLNDASTDTVKLAVNKVIGTSAAAIKSTTGLTALAGNLLIGCGFSNSTICGGHTVDEPKIWTKLLSQAELDEDYDSYVVSTPAVACYSQAHYQWEGVYEDANGDPIPIRSADISSVVVRANGAIALKIQIDCTGSAGSAVSFRPYYSTDGTNFLLPVPQTMGADNIWMWGATPSTGLNSGTTSGCIDATGLTAVAGSTVLDSTTSSTVTLAQDRCTTYRFIFKVGDIAGASRYIRLYQDNGEALGAGYDVTPRMNIIDPQHGTP